MAVSNDTKPDTPGRPKRPFWPTRQEAKDAAWVLLLFLSLPVAAFAPLPLLLLLRLLPDGDQWWLVATWIGLVLALVAVYRAWLEVAARIARKVFAGRLPPELYDWLRHEDPRPANALQALRANWSLGLFAALGLSVSLTLLYAYRVRSAWRRPAGDPAG